MLCAKRVEQNARISDKIIHQMEDHRHDLACFPLSLSMGDISDTISDQRAAFIHSTMMIPSPNFADIGKTEVDTARESLTKVLRSIDQVQPIRIWYSQNPDALCGLCCLLTLLPKDADIRVVELPPYELRENTLTTLERRHFIALWRELQQENGPLRAIVNGRLCTVAPDFYDCFILRELAKQPSEFHEGCLIGEILGKYRLGISDSLIALRIEDFITRGMLKPVAAAEEDSPIYHRWLRKGDPI